MDDETAEIELLEQNLRKTHQISQRMTSILNSFDTRMAKLEQSMYPLYNSTQILNRRASNIEKALLKIDEVASSQDGIAAEEALVLRGPQPGQLDLYKDAIERLNASIAFKASDPATQETARLVETGAKKLAQYYTKLVAEGSSGPTPIPGSDLTRMVFSQNLLATLQPLVAFLRTLPTPSTHPSHPAAPAILTTLKDSQKGYADMRGAWCKKWLEGQGRRVLDRADTIDTIASGNEFGDWVESMLVIAEDEFDLMTKLVPATAPGAIATAYTSLLNPLIVLFSTTLTSIVALVKRSLHKYTFLALSSYEHLLVLQPRWDAVLAKRGPGNRGENKKDANEYREGLSALRSVCLRSFPEFLADLKLAAMGGKGLADLSTGLADFVVSTVQYMERLPEVQGAAGAALVALGDGNWKMGEGMALKPKAKVLGEGDELLLLEHFIFDIITTAVTTLNTLAKSPKRPPTMNSVFLLNNISYLRRNIVIDPKHDSLIDLLSKPTQDTLNSNFRTAKAGYFDANFALLMQTMNDPNAGEKGGKTQTKERFTRFNDLLDEVLERHRVARVLSDDDEGRKEISEDVVKLIVPAFTSFTQKGKEKEFSKNPQKYIKMTPDDVESRLRKMYR